MRISVIVAFILLAPLFANAQITSYSDQVNKEMERRGLDREQLRALLYEKNIDLDNLENLTPQQILDLQRALEELQQLQTGEIVSTDTIPDLTEQDTDDLLMADLDTQVVTQPEDTAEVRIYGHHLFENGQIGLIQPNAENNAYRQ